jgi:hypothetical protein
MTDAINHQTISISGSSFISRVSSSILKEKCNRTRILYAGQGSKDNTINVYRLAEIFRGRYYLEETIYDVEKKSFTSNLSSVNYHNFHKKFNPDEFAHAINYKSPEINAVVSFTRSIDGATFKQSMFIDERKFKSILSPFTDIFLKRKLFSYMNKN